MGRADMKTENKKQYASQLRHWYSMLNWRIHANLAEEYFETVIRQAEESHYPEKLYVQRNDSHRQIQLSAGSHPIGELEEVYDASGARISRRFPTEKGAALVISQHANGSVAIFMYPYASDKMKMKMPLITWAIYSEPTKLTETVLRSATRDFFIYMRVSSAIARESFTDRLRIQFLEIKARKYDGKGSMVKIIFSHWSLLALGAAGSIASLWSVYK